MKCRILGYVAAIAVASSTAEAESIRGIAVQKIGEAMALAAKCSSLEVDASKITTAVESSGLAVKGLMDEAGAVSEKLIIQLQGSDEAVACELGLTMYGPDGNKAKGFLKPK
jgi:hypothetical protein